MCVCAWAPVYWSRRAIVDHAKCSVGSGLVHTSAARALWRRAGRLVLLSPGLAPLALTLLGAREDDEGADKRGAKGKRKGEGGGGKRKGEGSRAVCGGALVVGTDLVLTMADTLATTRKPRPRRPWKCDPCRLLRLLWCANARLSTPAIDSARPNHRLPYTHTLIMCTRSCSLPPLVVITMTGIEQWCDVTKSFCLPEKV